MAKPRLSPAMKHVLRNMADGLPADRGIHGQAAHGGFEMTLVALRKRDLIDRNYDITDAGREAVGKPSTTPPDGAKGER